MQNGKCEVAFQNSTCLLYRPEARIFKLWCLEMLLSYLSVIGKQWLMGARYLEVWAVYTRMDHGPDFMASGEVLSAHQDILLKKKKLFISSKE